MKFLVILCVSLFTTLSSLSAQGLKKADANDIKKMLHPTHIQLEGRAAADFNAIVKQYKIKLLQVYTDSKIEPSQIDAELDKYDQDINLVSKLGDAAKTNQCKDFLKSLRIYAKENGIEGIRSEIFSSEEE